ncbi:MAG: (Fe-S)-binding protein [Planctomycetota bacterium]|nr:MAG: (Fe-S)-binding protein [Planctomycetota bacterium]
MTHSGDPAARCTFCPKLCRDVCPVAIAEGSEAATPTWKGALAYGWRRGAVPLETLAGAIYRCTGCGRQRTACLHGIEARTLQQPVREAVWASGCAPPAVRRLVARMRERGQPFERPLAPVLERLARSGLPIAGRDRRHRRLLFTGCTALARRPQLVRAAAALAPRLPGGPSAFAPAVCCGLPLWAAGDREGFVRQLAAALRAIDGAQTVFVLDPGCARALGPLAAAYGLSAPAVVRPWIEALAAGTAALRGAIVRPIEPTVAYHDPCQLGRWRGVYEPPRELLALACGGRPPREFAACRQQADCAGGEGLYEKLHPAGARRIAARRLAAFERTGAAWLATACPSAATQLARCAPPGLRVGCVTELLALATGDDPERETPL